jgi:flagellar hook-associated protein 1
MSTFSGLTNALSSLNAQQYSLSVTADNMDNANTVGYTRKKANLEAVGPVGGVSRIYATATKYEGTVSADTATRTNDPVLDARNRTEQGLNSYAQTTQTTQSNVETVFDEPSDNGLAEQLNNFWSSWSNLANANTGATDASVREGVLSAGTKVAAALNATSAELSTQLDSANLTLSQTVASVNTAAAQVATLNRQIATSNVTGEDANDLTDQRDLLLVSLAKLAGATSTMNSDGTATVTLPGTGSPATPVTLVSGGTGVASTASTMATTGTPVTGVTVGGTDIGMTTGTLQGALDAVTTIIPGYQASLDAVATSLATAVNSAQAAGYTNTSPPTTGPDFFTSSNSDPLSAANISLAITDVTQIAASKTGSSTADTDGSNAAAIAAIGKQATGPDATYRTMIDALGNASAAATQASTVQQTVATNVSNLQQSASGVNMDEETTNVLIFQRAYQASSRVLTTVDEMLDTLINHTGTVGL